MMKTEPHTKPRWLDEGGNVAIELAFAVPVALLLLVMLFDFAFGFYDRMALESGARAGAQYAMKKPTDTAGIMAAAADASGLDPTTITVTPANFCECPDGTSVDCSGGCVGGPTLNFVSVAVSAPYRPILPCPGLGSLITLSATATLRVR
jgi:hypothetical protein